MKFKTLTMLALPVMMLTACEEEAPEVETTESSGEAAGEVLGGTISDDMLPLETLTSTSPPAEPTRSSTTTTVSQGEDGSTTVETTTETTSGDSDAPTPAPPVPPATPE